MLLLLWKWCIMTLWCRKNCAIKQEEQSFTVGRNQVFWRISQGWSGTTAGELRDEIQNWIISIFFLTLQVSPCPKNEEFCSQIMIICAFRSSLLLKVIPEMKELVTTHNCFLSMRFHMPSVKGKILRFRKWNQG